MKKAFTLIELMITILIVSIFLSFVFRFYGNVLIELRYLEAGDSLSYNAFRVSQILKHGAYKDADYIGGVVTLATYDDPHQFKTYNDGNTTTINTNNGKLTMVGSLNSYKFEDINIYNFKLENVVNNLYLFKFNAVKESVMKYSDLNESSYIPYQRLVYTQ